MSIRVVHPLEQVNIQHRETAATIAVKRSDGLLESFEPRAPVETTSQRIMLRKPSGPFQSSVFFAFLKVYPIEYRVVEGRDVVRFRLGINSDLVLELPTRSLITHLPDQVECSGTGIMFNNI